MNESPIRRFCESPHRNLIVIIATVLFGLLVLIPQVDDYFDDKLSRNALLEDLEHARQMAKKLPRLEIELAGIQAELAAFQSRAISKDSVSQYRTKVVDLVRKAECQVRRFDVSQPILRPWMSQDHPLNPTASQDAKNKKTLFSLERRNVVLIVDGSMEGATQLLKDLHKDNSFAYLHRMELKSASQNGEHVSIEIEMWLFALDKQKA